VQTLCDALNGTISSESIGGLSFHTNLQYYYTPVSRSLALVNRSSRHESSSTARRRAAQRGSMLHTCRERRGKTRGSRMVDAFMEHQLSCFTIRDVRQSAGETALILQ
jgi:hypothetical protein